MQNIINQNTLSYFSCEFFCLAGIILNSILYIFFAKKTNIKRISDFLTCIIFIICIITLAAIGITNSINFNEMYHFPIGEYIPNDKKTICLKISIYIFLLAFIFITYKLTRKIKFKTPVINSILLLIAIISGFLIKSENILITYVLLDILTILIYKFASKMRIKKQAYYSTNFIIIGICASVLFFGFYILTFLIKDYVQLNIINVCLTLAFFLKMGLFPFSNYISANNTKTNIPYSILLFGFLPWMATIGFNNITKFTNFTGEIYQISITMFLTLTIAYFGLMTLKQKNLTKFLAKSNYCLTSFCLLNTLFMSANNTTIKYSTLLAFCIMGLFSLLCIIKINLKALKINLLTIEGLAFNNQFFALIFSIMLLILTCTIPSGILKYGAEILKTVYSYDKLAFCAVFAITLANILILINSLKIIQSLYTVNLKRIKDKFKKKTMLNYIVSFSIIIFCAISLFL